MKPHLMSSSSSATVNMYRASQDGIAEVLAHPAVGVGDRDARAQTAHAHPQLTLASEPVWRHKLVLTGKLDHQTAVELQDEIECLCEEGVTVLTLDVRQLEAIDPVGARAIACGGAACRRRGHDFAVLPGGSPRVQRALSEAGAESLLASASSEIGLPQLATVAADGALRDTSTVMIKNL
jgi:anti-anti-sigma factor